MAKPHSTIAQAALTYIAALIALSGCTKKDPEKESARAPQLGIVRQADINSCPATSTSCSLLSDRDTTVYKGRTTVDYGKGHEICVGYAPTGANSNAVTNGAARALVHFPLGLLPPRAVVTDATLTLHGQRGRNAGVMGLAPLTDDSWLEGDGTGSADGAGNTGDGACGWQGTDTSRAAFGTTNNVTTPSVTVSVNAPPSDAVFNGLGPAVRAQIARNNFGWAVKQTNETGSDMNNQVFIFWSRETGVGGDAGRPTLNLTYGKGPGSSCTASSECLFGDGSAGFCASNHVCCSTSCANTNQCSFGVCAANGACSQQIQTGATCNDGDPCKTGDTCQSNGTCAGTPIVCPAPDQCHTQATCSNGVCPANPPKANGSTCTDGNACTTGDSCQGGNCTGTQVVCTALDQCHVPGSCSNGTCSNPTKMDGTTCDDGNSCTSGEACHGGVCNGGTGMTCPPADQCHTQASCSNGTCPANPPKPNGSTCDDGNSCTSGETCQSGVCTGGTGMSCPPADQCHTQASCSGGTCPANPP